MKTYITKSKSVKISKIREKSFSLSSMGLRAIFLKNNSILLSGLISNVGKGNDMEEFSFIKFKSDCKYLKTASLTSKNFLLDTESSNTFEYIPPIYNEKFIKDSKGRVINKYDILYTSTGSNHNIGDCCIAGEDYKYNFSSHIFNLKIKDIDKKFYIFALLNNKYGKEYCDLLVPKASIMRRGGKRFLDIKIPFPSKNNHQAPEKIEEFVSLIVQNLIDKEEQIKNKNRVIDEKIEKELRENQIEGKKFSSTKYTKISDIKDKGRLDSDIYSEKVREIEFITENYIKGCSFIGNNFKYYRGPNLAVSVIGNSYYSNEKKETFYRMFTNAEMQDNRTISGFRYLGSNKKLPLLPENCVMFSADGMIVGRSFFFDKLENTITNYHPWIIVALEKKLPQYKSVFLSVYLSYLKNIRYLEKIKDKSNGGGLKKGHMDKWIKIPNFEDLKQEEIAKEYYNKIEKNIDLDFENYLEKEKARNKELGIFQLNMEIFSLKEQLENLIDKIVMDKKMDINFDY